MQSASSLGKILAIVIGVAAGMAASSVRAADDGFDAFWKKFVAAIKNDDADSVKALTKFPISYDGEDRGANDFAVVWDGWFTEESRDCLSTETPAPDGDDYYVVFCGDLIFGFADVDGKWRFDGVTAND